MKSVALYVGDALGRYGFPQGHPFGPDRQNAFWAETQAQGLDRRVQLCDPVLARRAELERFCEPEFVDFNAAGEIAVTLQENNHIVIVSAESGEVVGHFSAGEGDVENIDLLDDGALRFDQSAKGIRREPDAAWLG